MYQLTVYYPSDEFGRARKDVPRAADALRAISDLLFEHADCARVEVTLNGARLFSVDCAGNKLD